MIPFFSADVIIVILLEVTRILWFGYLRCLTIYLSILFSKVKNLNHLVCKIKNVWD